MTRSESSITGLFSGNACCKPHDFFENIFNMVGDGICVTDDVGYIIKVNRTLCEMTGYTEQELIGMYGTDLYPEVDDPTLPSEDYKNIFDGFYKRSSDISTYDFYFKRKDGTLFPVELRITNVHASAGLTAAIIICARDITERRQQEADLRKALNEIARARDFLKTVFDMTSDGIYVTDDQGNIRRANNALCAMVGYTEEELVGMPPHIISPLGSAPVSDMATLEEFFTRDYFNYFETLYQRKDGSIFPVEAKITHFQDASGSTIPLLISVRDITERKRFEHKLETARDDLEQKVKDRTRSLEESNTALRVLLKAREEDRAAIEEKMLLNVKEVVIPYIEKLRHARLHNSQKMYLELMESNLNEIVSPFIHATKCFKLTHTEIEVANLIKFGKSTKEIAALLNCSPRTVDGHRDKIRKKLGIINQNINLRTYLLSLE